MPIFLFIRKCQALLTGRLSDNKGRNFAAFKSQYLTSVGKISVPGNVMVLAFNTFYFFVIFDHNY